MTQYSCRRCREWYDKKLVFCPICEAGPPEFNKSAYRQKLDNHTFAQAEASTPKAQHDMYYKEIKSDLDRLVREY